MFDDINSVYKSLCWAEDMKIVNYFNEHVWLKPLFVDGKRIGITDCCFVDTPCDKHKEMQRVEDVAKLN